MYIESTEFLNRYLKLNKKGFKFCFIIGSGASKTSGIPTGVDLMWKWKNELDNYSKEYIHDLIHRFVLQTYITEEEQQQEEKEYAGLFDDTYNLKSSDYSRIFDIRFFEHEKEGYRELENVMEGASPNIGYYYLAEVLSNSPNRISITTNFDSLIEDSIYYVSEKHPLVIGHEFLADFILERDRGPVIIKLHRDLLLNPMNHTKELSELKVGWDKPLATVLKEYIPIVVGYSGGDNTLMSLLERVDFRNGIYWCTLNGDESEQINNLINRNKGCFVRIKGFDELLFMLASKSEIIENYDIARMIKERADIRVREFERKRKILSEKQSLFPKKDLVYVTPIKNTSEQEEALAVQMLASRKFEKTPLFKKYSYANQLLSEGKYQEAIGLYDEIEKEFINFPIFFNRGIAYLQLSQFHLAERDFRKDLELHNKSVESYIQLGVALLSQNKLPEAKAYYEQMLDFCPENAAIAYYNLGLVYDQEGNLRKANKCYSKTIQAGGESLKEAYINRGRNYMKMKQYDKAIIDFNAAKACDSKFVKAYTNLANAYSFMDLHEQSAENFELAKELTPDDMKIWVDLGHEYECLGNFEKALEHYSFAIKQSPRFVNAFICRGRLLGSRSRYDEAICDFKKAIQIDSMNSCAYSYLGLAYSKKEQIDDAIEACEKALKYDPNNKLAKDIISELQ